MRRRYKDCQRADANCALCSLVSYGRDCHGKNIGKLEWHRMAAELTQQELATQSGINISQIQRLESGDAKAGNITLKNAIAIADALGVEVRELV